MARHKVIRSPKQLRKTRQKTIRRVVFFSVLVLGIAGAIIYGLLRPELRISSIEIDGKEGLPKEDITAFIKTGMQGTYLGFIPKAHILFYPENALKAGVLSAFPALSRVDFSRGSLSAIQVSAISRNPYILWCEMEECFLMDETGFVFAEAGVNAEALYYKIVRETEATSTPLGAERVEAGRLSGLFSLLTQLETLGLDIVELRLLQNGEHTVVARGGARLLFGTAPFDLALTRLQTLLAEKRLVPRKGLGLNVDYIDLRYGNKIYFK